MKIADVKAGYSLGSQEMVNILNIDECDIWNDWFINGEWVRSEDAISNYGYCMLFKQNYELIILENSLTEDEI